MKNPLRSSAISVSQNDDSFVFDQYHLVQIIMKAVIWTEYQVIENILTK